MYVWGRQSAQWSGDAQSHPKTPQKPTRKGFESALAEVKKVLPEDCISVVREDLQSHASSDWSCEPPVPDLHVPEFAEISRRAISRSRRTLSTWGSLLPTFNRGRRSDRQDRIEILHPHRTDIGGYITRRSLQRALLPFRSFGNRATREKEGGGAEAWSEFRGGLFREYG